MDSSLPRSMWWQPRVCLALSTIVVGACSPLSSTVLGAEDVIFLAANAPATMVMEALYKGSVVADAAGCVRLAGASEQHTVLWPYGFALRQHDGAATVVDAGGREIGRIGSSFTFGGGEVPTLHEGIALSDAQRELALQRCPGRYWIVGEVP
jgi:hypothetical protein